MTDCFNNLRIISAERVKTTNTISIASLSYHALLIRANDRAVYTIGENKITSVRGDVVFIPMGSSYTVKPVGGDNDFAIVRFIASGEHSFEILRADDLSEALSLHAALARSMVFEDKKSRLRAISYFYRLLSLASPRDSEHMGLSRRKLSLMTTAELLEVMNKQIEETQNMINLLTEEIQLRLMEMEQDK